MRRILRPPSPAMIVATIALIAALTASAGALPGTNSIFKDDIRKDAVGLSELREEGDRDGGLTGAYVVESSLGIVPLATAAERATVADRAVAADSAARAGGLVAPEAYRVVGAPGNPGFENGCGNVGAPYGSAAFFKDHEGMVHLRGAVTCSGTSQPAFLLPPGYRPAAGAVHSQLQSVANRPGGIGAVVVGGTTGAVTAPNASGAFWIDGISFRAAG